MFKSLRKYSTNANDGFKIYFYNYTALLQLSFQFTSCQQKPGMKERRQAKDDRTKLTEELMATVPLLLSKYKMDGDKMASLLIVPRYFDLEQYVTGRFVCTMLLLFD